MLVNNPHVLSHYWPFSSSRSICWSFKQVFVSKGHSLIDDVNHLCVCNVQASIYYKLVLWSFLRRLFGPNKDEYREWKTLHKIEFHSLYRSPNVLRVIKFRRLKWARHVTRVEEGAGNFHHFITIRIRLLGRIESVQDKDYLRALVNSALNLWIP